MRWQLGQKILPYPVVYTFVDDSKLVVSKGMTGATGNIYVGLLEFNEMSFVLHLLRESDTFGDIGANVGVYSILASVNAGAFSVAAEPVPVTYTHLLRNVKVNNAEGKITALQCGVGAKEGVLKFTDNFDTINGVVVNQDTNEHTVSVHVNTLDNIFSGKKPVLLKIDVEGYEWQVLQGATSLFADPTLKAVIIEINGAGKAYGIADDDIHDFMVSHGFRPYGYEPFLRDLLQWNSYGPVNTIYLRDVVWVMDRVKASRKFNVLGIDI
ncbi:MAG: FkbM family methyltransferase [Candidatus Kuenenia stuttgartiensis]|nr:FkbM family methyltransferase [Candidatus Kuenenia stuttgartiensis]